MLSKSVMLRLSINLARSLHKVDTVAHMHVGCSHNMSSAAAKYLRSCRKQVLFSEVQRRHESSTSTQMTVTNEPAIGTIPEPPVVPLNELPQSSIQTISEEPSFASLGLGSWWPPGIVQNCMELLHVTCDLPWWASVACGTLVIRLCLFPITVISQRNAAKINNSLPQIQELQCRATEAKQRGDKYLAAKYSADVMMLMSEKGVNPFKGMIPPLCQAPIFISVFMGLRGMASLPVESLKTGGLFWFTDLTVPDQFYLLPIITSATLFCTIKLGADTAQTTKNMLVSKYLLMALPVVMFPFTINFPGLLLMYWTTTNFITLAQVFFLRLPKIRDFFKIERFISHQPNSMPFEDKGFINNVKEAWTNIKITSQLDDRERVDKMAFMRAGREPIKKTYKYDPTKVNPSMTAVQAKKMS